MSLSKKLEEQASCPHSHLSKEVIFGQKTGDNICSACGETFMRKEEILPPEHRCSIITSVHALLIAFRANPKLKLTSNYEANYIGIYEWALVDSENKIVIPIMASVANEAISADLVRI